MDWNDSNGEASESIAAIDIDATTSLGHEWESTELSGESEEGDTDDEDLEGEGLDLGDFEEEVPVAAPTRTTPPGHHVVAQGETVASIAASYGFYSHEKIWQAAENSELRRTRDPGVLLPGDRLFIPARTPKYVTVESSRRHVFVVKSCMVTVKLRLLDETGAPRSGVRYEVALENHRTVASGETGGDGTLEARVPASATQATVTLVDPDDEDHEEEVLDLAIGALDPADTVGGVRERLRNLAYYDGLERDEASLRLYQALASVPLSGALDPDVATKLDCDHDTRGEQKRE